MCKNARTVFVIYLSLYFSTYTLFSEIRFLQYINDGNNNSSNNMSNDNVFETRQFNINMCKAQRENKLLYLSLFPPLY